MKNSIVYLIGPTESLLTKRGNRFPNFADHLLEKKNDVVYYTSNFYHAEKRFFSKEEIRDVKQECQYDFRVLKVLGYYNNVSPRRVISNFVFSFQLFFILLFKVKKQDKVLLPSRPVELIYFIALLKRLRGCQIFLDIQDVWPDALEIENKRKKRIFEIYCNFYLNPSLKHYTNTMHVAPTFKKWLHRYAKNVPSEFLPLGWENSRWGDVKEKTKIDTDQIKMVCVAQLQHQIDIMPILEVLKSNKNLFLTVVGEDGKGERYQEVIDYIKANNIENIKIHGKVEREDMKGYLANNTVGVLPMITPSIPNKIFDYLASGLPIVVLGENDSSEFVKNNGIGWSSEFNSQALQKLLSSLTEEDFNEKQNKVLEIRLEYSRDKLHNKLDQIL